MPEEPVDMPPELMEMMADDEVEALRESVATENQLVQAEHSFSDKLNSWSSIFGNLVENHIVVDSALQGIVTEIMEKLTNFRDLVEADMKLNVHFMQEETKVLAKVDEAARHKEWRAVDHAKPKGWKRLVNSFVNIGRHMGGYKKIEKQSVRLSKNELIQLHKLTIDIMKLMKRSKHVKLADVSKEQDKDSAKNQVQYYLTEVYKFLMAYERVLRNLWSKERALAK